MRCTDTQREAGGKSSKTVAAMYNEEKDNSNKDKEVATVQRQKFSKFSDKKKKTNTSQAANKGVPSGTRPGHNANRNGKYCFYCKLQNHTQEDCFKRICKKKPCRDKQGHAYWPEVYVTSNSDQQERDQQGQQQGFR